MRKHARNWMMRILLGIIIIVFALYFGSMGGRHRAEAIVSIDGKIITETEFRRQYQDLLEMYRQRFGGLLSEDMIRSMNLKEQVLNKMINEILLMKKAEEMKIKVTEEELRRSIISIPAFQRNGVFDENLYQRMLRYNKIKPDEFEEMQRKNLIASKIEDLILDGIHVTQREVREYYQSRNAKVNIIKCTIPTSEFTNKITFTRNDVEKFYREHEGKFKVPARVQVSYILFRATEYANKAEVSQEEIAEYRKRLKEKMADEKIIAEIKKSKGMSLAYEEAKKAHDEIYQLENFEAYATKHGLKIQTTEYFDENSVPNELKGINNLIKTAFSLQPKEISRVLATGEAYAILKLTGKKEAYTPPLAQIEQKVREEYIKEESKKMALKVAETIIDRIKKGEDLIKIARKEKLSLSETGIFTITSPPSNLANSMEVFSALARLGPNNRVIDTPLASADGYLILQLKEWIPPTEEGMSQKLLAAKETFLHMKKVEAIRFWIEALKSNLIKDGRLKFLKDIKEL
ncbi:MAG: SurA N-terminal domain-containing protein [Syntrophales bacterium]|nr:SurA N-terminal domain-containing protein [Syntrophales bacterium]